MADFVRAIIQARICIYASHFMSHEKILEHSTASDSQTNLFQAQISFLSVDRE